MLPRGGDGTVLFSRLAADAGRFLALSRISCGNQRRLAHVSVWPSSCLAPSVLFKEKEMRENAPKTLMPREKVEEHRKIKGNHGMQGMEAIFFSIFVPGFCRPRRVWSVYGGLDLVEQANRAFGHHPHNYSSFFIKEKRKKKKKQQLWLTSLVGGLYTNEALHEGTPPRLSLLTTTRDETGLIPPPTPIS